MLWALRHSFLPGNKATDELAKWEALIVPSAVPCRLSFISAIHSPFSDWRRTVSYKFFDTHVSSEELVLPCHAYCVFARLCCHGHRLLLSSYFTRIGRIDNPLCNACCHLSPDTSHLILHCVTVDSLRCALCFSVITGPSPGELFVFWDSMVFRHAFIFRKGSGNNSITGSGSCSKRL